MDNIGGETATGIKVSEQGALSLIYAYSAIKVLAETLAHVPLELFQKTDTGNVPQVNHPLYNLVKTRPSINQSSFRWRETMEGHRSGWGNAYSWVQRDPRTKQIAAIQLLFPDKTMPKALADGTLVYETRIDDQSIRIPASDIIHVPGLGYDGLLGYSPVQIAKESMGLGLAMHDFSGRFFKNGATPKGIIESEVNTNSLVKWSEEFKLQHGGLEQSSGTPILPKGLTYKQISINPDDALVLETMRFNRTEIAALYRVPAQFVGDLEQANFSNAVQFDLHFVKHTMVPIYVNYEQEFDFKLLTQSERDQGFFFKFNVNGLLRGDQAARFAAFHTALQDGWLNRNEVRELEDRSTENPELDEFLQPNNMMMVGQLPVAPSGSPAQPADDDDNEDDDDA